MIELRQATAEELLQQQQSTEVAAVPSITAEKFTYFACFDGTNNDRSDLSVSDTSIQTSVAAIAGMAEGLESPRIATRYFAGLGTANTLFGSSALPSRVTAQINSTAEAAYADFTVRALAWLAANPSNNPSDVITTAVTGFSRGCATAIRFAQILNARGLVAVDGTVLIQGGVKVDAMALMEPVTTGYLDNLSIPGNVNNSNAVSFRARDEYRYAAPGINKSGLKPPSSRTAQMASSTTRRSATGEISDRLPCPEFTTSCTLSSPASAKAFRSRLTVERSRFKAVASESTELKLPFVFTSSMSS